MQLSIVTPERRVLETEVDEVVAPGAEGEFGVLPEHEAFLAPLKPGVVRYQGGEGSGRVAVSTGFAEVSGDRVSLLVQTAESSDEVDRPRAEHALSSAEEALRYTTPDTPTGEIATLREAIARAEARLAATAE
jgi:F-type H+-transporting ATPase subunit epsilon